MKKLLILFFLLSSCSLFDNASPLDQKLNELLAPVVRINIFDENSGGSGTIISSVKEKDLYNNIVLTNWHVIVDLIDDPMQTKPEVIVFNYDENGYVISKKSYSTDILYYNQELDAAILCFLSSEKMTTAYMYPTTGQLKLFDEVHIVGRQLSDDPSTTTGYITELFGIQYDGWQYIKVNANIIYGNSGGACFTFYDGHYCFIGIPSRVAVCYQAPITHMAYICPWNIVLEKLIEDKILLEGTYK